ncbi:hypothetical protein [Colwellia sp. RSH04]|uniref:hypothetical protein n=1 Tax=Colwellia sp. RSH04 TaxID=2305464 RepID=UPI000E58EF22|nr:hypothetical protein [Colwellia sp. RSH04]RHW74735.1 hypothetical protein D1094_17000 [Colwellia sp. RSH04]
MKLLTPLKSYWWKLLAFLFTSSPSIASEKVKVKIAAVDWCPQLCPRGNVSGYINEILSSIYPSELFTLDIDYLPWSRAIKLVNKGDYQMLLAPTKEEAPDLKYPLYPIGIQQMCFFTLTDSNWSYINTDSLKGLSEPSKHIDFNL